MRLVSVWCPVSIFDSRIGLNRLARSEVPLESSARFFCFPCFQGFRHFCAGVVTSDTQQVRGTQRAGRHRASLVSCRRPAPLARDKNPLSAHVPGLFHKVSHPAARPRQFARGPALRALFALFLWLRAPSAGCLALCADSSVCGCRLDKSQLSLPIRPARMIEPFTHRVCSVCESIRTGKNTLLSKSHFIWNSNTPLLQP